MEPRDLIGLQIRDLWGRGRTELVRTLYAPDVTDHMPIPGQPGGLDALAAVVETFRAAIPDMAIEVHAILQQGDMAADIWTLTGTHLGPLGPLPPSGRPLRFSGIDMVRVRDRRIADIWHVEDLNRMTAQMGGVASVPAVTVAGGMVRPVPPPPGRAEAARLFAAAFGDPDGLDALAGLLAADVEDHTPFEGQAEGAAGLLARAASLAVLHPDRRPAVERVLVEGDWAAVRWSLAGPGAALNGMHGLRFAGDGRIDRVWTCLETPPATTALPAAPPDGPYQQE